MISQVSLIKHDKNCDCGDCCAGCFLPSDDQNDEGLCGACQNDRAEYFADMTYERMKYGE